MTAPKEIIRLVKRFDEHRETYQSPQYNETQLRREFLDPFFEALGWDVENKQGYAAAYKDVIHEDAIKIGGITKAPDYCFRILRICEDRGIEPEGRLLALTTVPGIYGRLIELYRKADERYNSGLFHFRQEKGRAEEFDQLTPGLKIEDKVLQDILKNLYYPDSPYEFSVLPADILGQVYEQFLGKVIRLTAGHQAKVEDKPEVKKAGGVFYTPSYIVEYIVLNTVGHLLEGNNPKEAARLTILDPACGSGSFLLGAYQFLLDWHREWYVNDGKEKWATGKHPVLYQGTGGEWRLTTMERKRILTNNIFGVDIDSQAVEVTKLSLLLKVLEGESEQTLSSQFKLFHERALPDLGRNIKCGNSLIGSDFYQGESGVLPMFGEEERLRINVFDWEKEFPRIFSGVNPGFDVGIGNPPYGYMIPDPPTPCPGTEGE